MTVSTCSYVREGEVAAAGEAVACVRNVKESSSDLISSGYKARDVVDYNEGRKWWLIS